MKTSKPELLTPAWLTGGDIVSAWVLMPPEFIEQTKQPDNFVSPGAAAFASEEEALAFAAAFEGYKGQNREAFEVWLPGTWERCTTLKRSTSYTAFHFWHRGRGVKKSLKCGLCLRWDVNGLLPNPALITQALILDPDTKMPFGWPVQ